MMNTMPLGLLSQATAATEPRRRPATHLDPVADFGAVGDGVTDNAGPLMAMRQHMADRWDQHFEVRFPYGHYVYSNNRWLDGVGSVTVDGSGAKIECISDSQWGVNNRPFALRDIFDDGPVGEPLTSINRGGEIKGCPQIAFKRAIAGAKTLQVKPAIDNQPYLDPATLAPGDQVFLWAFDQQFAGYPPNMRYFEWNEITEVNITTSSVQLRSPLRFDYEEHLPDDMTWDNLWYGSARLFKLYRPSGYRYPRFIKLSNLMLVPNRNSIDDAHGLHLACNTLIIDNVVHDSGFLWVGMNQSVELSNSVIHKCDIDKLGDTLRIRDCRFFNSVGPASGFLNVSIENSVIDGSVYLCARRNRIAGNRIAPEKAWGAIRLSSVTSIERLEARDNHVTPQGDLYHVINTDVARTITPDAVEGRDIILDDTTDARKVISVLDVGAKLIRGLEAGEITRIWYDSSVTQWHIVTTFVSIDTSQEFLFVVGQSLSQNGNVVNDNKTWPARDFALLFKQGFIDVTIPGDMQHYYPSLYGFVSRVEIRVVRAYQKLSGDQSDPVLVAQLLDQSGIEVARMVVDVTQPGIVRTGLPDDVVVGAGSRVEKSLPANNFVSRVKLLAYRDQSTWERGWGGEDADKPVIQFRVEGQSIL